MTPGRDLADVLDPHVAKAAGATVQDGHAVPPVTAAIWRLGPPATGALVCSTAADALAAASVLYEATRRGLRYRRDLPPRLYELEIVAALGRSPAVVRDLRTAGIQRLYVDADRRREVALRHDAEAAGLVVAGAIEPGAPSLAAALAQVPAEDRAAALARMLRRAAVVEMRRALAVVASEEPQVVAELLSTRRDLLSEESLW